MKSLQVGYQAGFSNCSFNSVTTKINRSRHGPTQSAFEEIISPSSDPSISVLSSDVRAPNTSHLHLIYPLQGQKHWAAISVIPVRVKNA